MTLIYLVRCSKAHQLREVLSNTNTRLAARTPLSCNFVHNRHHLVSTSERLQSQTPLRVSILHTLTSDPYNTLNRKITSTFSSLAIGPSLHVSTMSRAYILHRNMIVIQSHVRLVSAQWLRETSFHTLWSHSGAYRCSSTSTQAATSVPRTIIRYHIERKPSQLLPHTTWMTTYAFPQICAITAQL